MYTLQNLPLHIQDESWGIKRRCHSQCFLGKSHEYNPKTKTLPFTPHLNHNPRLPVQALHSMLLLWKSITYSTLILADHRASTT